MKYSSFQNKVVLDSSTRKVFIFPEKLGTSWKTGNILLIRLGQAKPLCFHFALSARKLRTTFKAQMQSQLICRARELAFLKHYVCKVLPQNIFNWVLGATQFLSFQLYKVGNWSPQGRSQELSHSASTRWRQHPPEFWAVQKYTASLPWVAPSPLWGLTAQITITDQWQHHASGTQWGTLAGGSQDVRGGTHGWPGWTSTVLGRPWGWKGLSVVEAVPSLDIRSLLVAAM